MEIFRQLLRWSPAAEEKPSSCRPFRAVLCPLAPTKPAFAPRRDRLHQTRTRFRSQQMLFVPAFNSGPSHHIQHAVRGSTAVRATGASRVLESLRACRPGVNVFSMSLAEIEKAVDQLSPDELTKLAAYVVQRDKLTWDKEIKEDFSPGGKHENALEKIDAEIDSGNFTRLP
jgi:hypothetical protein